jgi:hypothetical protein
MLIYDPDLVRLDKLFKPAKNIKQHRANIADAIYELSKRKVTVNSDWLGFHQMFKAVDDKIVVLVVPWAGHFNFCINDKDREKILKYYGPDRLRVLFARFEPQGFTLFSYKAWDQLPEGRPMNKNKNFGPCQFIREEDLRHDLMYNSEQVFG